MFLWACENSLQNGSLAGRPSYFHILRAAQFKSFKYENVWGVPKRPLIVIKVFLDFEFIAHRTLTPGISGRMVRGSKYFHLAM